MKSCIKRPFNATEKQGCIRNCVNVNNDQKKKKEIKGEK